MVLQYVGTAIASLSRRPEVAGKPQICTGPGWVSIKGGNTVEAELWVFLWAAISISVLLLVWWLEASNICQGITVERVTLGDTWHQVGTAL